MGVLESNDVRWILRLLLWLFTNTGVVNIWRTLLTHWGQVTHVCVSRLTTIGSDNGLSPGQRQAIIWTIAGILLIGPFETNFSEILIEIHAFSFRKMHWKMSGKWRPFCLGINLLNHDALLSDKQCMIYDNESFWITNFSELLISRGHVSPVS